MVQLTDPRDLYQLVRARVLPADAKEAFDSVKVAA